VLLTVHQDELIEAGRSAVPHIYLIDPEDWKGCLATVPYSPDPGSKAWVLLDGESSMRRGTYVGPVYERDDKGEVKMRKSKVLEGTKIESVEVAVTKPGLHTISIEDVEYEIDSSYCLLERSTDRCIVNFKERNNIIAEWVKHFAADQGKRTLVVATRTVHVLILEALLTSFPGIDPEKVMTLIGEDSPNRRNKAFAWFKNTPGAILITPLIKEGVSINEIEAGIIADYVGDWEYANQIIGRFLRKKDVDNSVEIAWFIDRQQERFERGCLRMFKKLKAVKGYLYYWPVTLLSDIPQVESSDTTAILESKTNRRQIKLKL
jgi:ribosomal protein L23